MEQNSTWSIMNVRLALVMPMVVATASIGFAAPAEAAGTAAGTTISNVATVSYTDAGGTPRTNDSPQVDLLVDEVLDVDVVAVGSSVIVQPGATGRVLSFDLTNTGNGPEAFSLTPNGTVGGDQFDPTVDNVYLDNLTPGQGTVGVYDPGIDILYTPGSNDPVLTADTSRRIFVVSSIPAGATDAQTGIVTLEAEATTGTGAAGTAFAGQGVGGGDAIVGTTGADDDANGTYLIQNATIAFTKAQSVAAPATLGGGTRTVPGSIITYTLTATVSGSGSLTNVSISDSVPANTTYEAGTMTLQSAPLTDVSDADAGNTTTTGPTVTGINVSLGTVPAGQTRTVTFQVKVN